MNYAYVLVEVHYDWYSFHKNLAVADSLELALNMADGYGLPILNDSHAHFKEREKVMRACEQRHILIQTFPIHTRIDSNPVAGTGHGSG